MSIQEIPRAPGVYRIRLAWSNCYILAAADREDVWLVDAGLRRDREQLLGALDEIHIPPARVHTILLTHGHCDHAGNASHFAEQYGTRIMAHPLEEEFVRLPRRAYGPRGAAVLVRPVQAAAFITGEMLFPVERCRSIARVYENETLDAPGGSLLVVASPGHTEGHISFFRSTDGVLFSGDAVINIRPHLIRRFRRIELSVAVPLFSSDMRQARQSARKLAEMEPTVLLGGHGPPLVEDTSARMRAWAETLAGALV